MTDENYMRHALDLAKKGVGFVNPNPLVGAIIVKNNEVIGAGFHEKYGGPHAEVNAFASLKESPVGATMYVTLEPCTHYGKTPPCVDAIIQSGVSRVVVANLDPNPLVAGKSLAKMKEAGITVKLGVLKEECEALNAVFFHFITTGTPYVTMKYAMTADGKIATHTKDSKWITGEVARNHVHKERHRNSAIMIGVNTLTQDDPMLDCRIPGGRNPIRIICDTALRTPLDSKIVQTASKIPTIFATATTDEKKHKPFFEHGCEIIVVPDNIDKVDLKALMKKLGARGIDSILLEGGSHLHGSAIDAGIIQKVQAYIGAKIFGGYDAPSPIAGTGFATVKEAYSLTNPKITQLETDFLIEGEVAKEAALCSQES